MSSGTLIIDRRSQRGRSSPSRQRLLRRIDQQIKNAIPDIIEGNSLDQLTTGEQKIFIPIGNLEEPHFSYDDDLGRRNRFYTGNDKFVPGDKFPRPPKGSSNSEPKEASDDPTKDEDKFGIILSRDEFLEYFYKDLELPLLEDRRMAHSLDSYHWVHAGTTRKGSPSRLNILHSFRNALGRKIALRSVFDHKIHDLEEEIEDEDDPGMITMLQEELSRTKRKKATIPFLEEDPDLRYNLFKKELIPTHSAVVFCLMDVSASMSKEEKDIAKRFYFFLYLMLTLNYDTVDVVWIRHTTDAQRVSEKDFFESKETGGTVVSSSLELANNIRLYGDELSPGGYPTKNWNIYFAQASDGDNFYSDMQTCVDILSKSLMPATNYYAYVQIRSPMEQNLWKYYLEVQQKYAKRFHMRHINKKSEIWGIFSDLFRKKISK